MRAPRCRDAHAFILNLSGLENYVAERGWEACGGMTPQLYALIQHIRAVKIEYRFERPDNYSAAGLRELADWAAQANAIFVLPDGSVRDAQGRDLLDPDGRRRRGPAHRCIPAPPRPGSQSARRTRRDRPRSPPARTL
ncbi:hypothetical protein [Gulosibacter hominis]|uniref:hypothetical protein n=1 Tax=Gulosibacter hominis TaxID=2770504 RepID=UPI00191ACC23|nr:hypothetical protein [Gulosibacter hominis]